MGRIEPTVPTVTDARTHLPATRGGDLEDVVAAIRAALAGGGDWGGIAARVSAAVSDHLPAASVLGPGDRAGSRERLTTHRLHVEPDGSFSLVALVCRQHQRTQIHDHVSWCVFAVLAGELVEELFTLDEAQRTLTPAGCQIGRPGTVSGGAPPGDIHRLVNLGERPAISLHVYGTDVSRIGSSVRRIYDLPVGPGRSPTSPVVPTQGDPQR